MTENSMPKFPAIHVEALLSLALSRIAEVAVNGTPAQRRELYAALSGFRSGFEQAEIDLRSRVGRENQPARVEPRLERAVVPVVLCYPCVGAVTHLQTAGDLRLTVTLCESSDGVRWRPGDDVSRPGAEHVCPRCDTLKREASSARLFS